MTEEDLTGGPVRNCRLGKKIYIYILEVKN